MVTWPIDYCHVTLKCQFVTQICLKPNISKTTADVIYQQSLTSLLWGSTVGYPSDSLASCFNSRNNWAVSPKQQCSHLVIENCGFFSKIWVVIWLQHRRLRHKQPREVESHKPEMYCSDEKERVRRSCICGYYIGIHVTVHHIRPIVAKCDWQWQQTKVAYATETATNAPTCTGHCGQRNTSPIRRWRSCRRHDECFS